jgi:hypothetical protein
MPRLSMLWHKLHFKSVKTALPGIPAGSPAAAAAGVGTTSREPSPRQEREPEDRRSE